MKLSADEFRDLTRNFLSESLTDEKSLISEQRQEPADVRTFREVGGDQPVFHDAAMDQALNDYVMQYVDRLEEDIGESRGTLALLENMKAALIDALENGIANAISESGVDY